MTARRILLASPREPSGGSWLINALLELGVRVNFKPVVDRVWRAAGESVDETAMWQPAGSGWVLHPRADALRKWLPVLSTRATLAFRDDLVVHYVQDPACADFQGTPTALFVRDPRDAIQSLYRRLRPDMALDEHVRFPHPQTLLDAPSHWQLFVESWLARPGVRVYRFEDYKADAGALLARIVGELGIDASAAEIARAAEASSYEKARAAEAAYRAAHPGDDEVAMRAGRVGEWKEAPELAPLTRAIESQMGPLLQRLGYAVEAAGAPHIPDLAPLRTLAEFHRIELPPAWRAAAAQAPAGPRVAELQALARTLDTDTIARARVPAQDARALLQSLAEFARHWQPSQVARLEALCAGFENGTDYALQRIAELARRVKAKRAAAAGAPERTAAAGSAGSRSPPEGG